MPETQDTRRMVPGIRAVIGSTEEHVAMADSPLRKVDMREKAISAAGAAFLSAVIVNPLDVAKVSLKPDGECLWTRMFTDRTRSFL